MTNHEIMNMAANAYRAIHESAHNQWLQKALTERPSKPRLDKPRALRALLPDARPYETTRQCFAELAVELGIRGVSNGN